MEETPWLMALTLLAVRLLALSLQASSRVLFVGLQEGGLTLIDAATTLGGALLMMALIKDISFGLQNVGGMKSYVERWDILKFLKRWDNRANLSSLNAASLPGGKPWLSYVPRTLYTVIRTSFSPTKFQEFEMSWDMARALSPQFPKGDLMNCCRAERYSTNLVAFGRLPACTPESHASVKIQPTLVPSNENTCVGTLRRVTAGNGCVHHVHGVQRRHCA
jgi:hypothetical protein